MNGRWSEALEDLTCVLQGVDEAQMKAFEGEILSGKRIFVTGLGRTGLMARGFAMRLMHLGRRVYHVGDVITPAIREDDLLILCSRTGRSKVLSYYIDIVRKVHGRVATVTAYPESAAGRKSDVVLALDDRPAVAARKRRGKRPGAPLGSLFEQALLVVLDQVVVDLMAALGLTEADLARIHTTFE